ncbi:MAG: hypothetical protein RSF40_06220, partial [Oscillospiraceae bacterium]
VFLNTWQITFGKKHKLTNFITHVFGLYVLEPVHNLFNNKAMKARLVTEVTQPFKKALSQQKKQSERVNK